MDSLLTVPQLAPEISFVVPLVLSLALFLVTQITKNVKVLKNWKPDFILWPLALGSTFVLALLYQPDLTVGQLYQQTGVFVANAGALHLGKKLIWDNLPLLFDMFSGKRRRLP